MQEDLPEIFGMPTFSTDRNVQPLRPTPEGQRVPDSTHLATAKNSGCKYYEVNFSGEHLALFKQLLASLSLVYARSVVLIRRSIRDAGIDKDKVSKAGVIGELESTLLSIDAFEKFVKDHIPEAHWISLMSLHSKLVHMVGDQAYEHVRVWEALHAAQGAQRCGFLKPHLWILDFIPLSQEVWNVKKKYSRGDNEFRQMSRYRPLFCPEN